MKKALILLALSVMLTGCAGYQINGVETSKFRNATLKEGIAYSAGILTSGVVHTLGHAVYLESKGADWAIEGHREVVYSHLSDGEWSAAGRSGALAQVGVGLILNWWKPESFFTDGFDTMTLLEIATYPLRQDDGDIDCIERSGNQREEWAAYTVIAGGLLLWSGDDGAR